MVQKIIEFITSDEFNSFQRKYIRSRKNTWKYSS